MLVEIIVIQNYYFLHLLYIYIYIYLIFKFTFELMEFISDITNLIVGLKFDYI
jgi:hypothetical protein